MDKKTEKVVNAYHETKFDPNGSYTGLGQHDEYPVQDADDL